RPAALGERAFTRAEPSAQDQRLGSGRALSPRHEGLRPHRAEHRARAQPAPARRRRPARGVRRERDGRVHRPPPAAGELPRRHPAASAPPSRSPASDPASAALPPDVPRIPASGFTAGGPPDVPAPPTPKIGTSLGAPAAPTEPPVPTFPGAGGPTVAAE